jgi:hypothetical protein
MLSAAPPPFSSSSLPPPLLREVQVLYRRVCVLRASGKSVEADALEAGKLAPALAKVRESSSGNDAIEKQLEALFAHESDRVDTAHALAELLLPMLTAAEETAPFRRSRFGTAPGFETPREAAAATPYDGATDIPPPASNSGPMLPGIADFIDEMLVQERAPNARRPA